MFHFNDFPWDLEMRVGIKSLHELRLLLTYKGSGNSALIILLLMLTFDEWYLSYFIFSMRKRWGCPHKVSSHLNSLRVSSYANGKVAWDCLRWQCRPDLLKWELKAHFKGLLCHMLFASAQTHCPHAGCLRPWEGVVWFYEMCCCQCRWRNATLWVYGSNSVFCLPRTNSQLHAYLSTFFFQKGRKWNLQTKYFLTFFHSTNGLCFQDIFLYTEIYIP